MSAAYEKYKETTSNIRGCSVGAVISMVLPVAMIVMGSLYVDECPARPFIPIYLVVSGLVYILTAAVSLLSACKADEEGDRPKIFEIISLVVSLFVMAWFIAGNVWIYSLTGQYSSDPEDEDYCNETLYLFSFWVSTGSYSVLGLGIVLTSMCCCCCCAAACMPGADNSCCCCCDCGTSCGESCFPCLEDVTSCCGVPCLEQPAKRGECESKEGDGRTKENSEQKSGKKSKFLKIPEFNSLKFLKSDSEDGDMKMDRGSTKEDKKSDKQSKFFKLPNLHSLNFLKSDSEEAGVVQGVFEGAVESAAESAM